MQTFGGTLRAAISLRKMRLEVLPLVAEGEAQFSSDAIRVLNRSDVPSDPRLNRVSDPKVIENDDPPK